MPADLEITDRVILAGDHLSWTAVRSSGPGGQNVNKVASKVVLRFDLEASDVLSPMQKERLRKIAGGRLDADGSVVITSQATRNQARNLADARDKLAELVRRCLKPPKKRRPTKPSRGAKRRRLEDKRRQSEKKQSRAKIRH